MVVNPNSGSDSVDPTDEIIAMWPKAHVIRIEPGVDVVAVLTRSGSATTARSAPRAATAP